MPQTHPAVIGRCPDCEVRISGRDLLFETDFESTDGSITYAECPSCGDVVNPLTWGSDHA